MDNAFHVIGVSLAFELHLPLVPSLKLEEKVVSAFMTCIYHPQES